MRRIAVLAAVLLAFAAGWFGRGCAGESVPTIDATTPTARPAEPQPAPVRAARTTPRPRATEEPTTRATRADGVPPKQPSDAESPPVPPGTPVVPAALQNAAKPLSAFAGVVVDSRTGAGVEGVNVHLCYSEDGEHWGWYGETTDADGKFACTLDPQSVSAKNRFEVRAGRNGYRTARIPVTTPDVRVEIEKLAHPERPGRIVGVARAEDGTPLTGRLFVGVQDDLDMRGFHAWTNADANGRFAVDGVPAGHIGVALAESDARVEVVVAEGGEASVELRAKFDRPPTGCFAPGTLTEAQFAREKARLEGILFGALRSSGDSVADAAGYALQQLELQWLRYAPGRDVVVTGMPADADGGFVRLQHRQGAGCLWHAPIADGKAKLTSIPLGKWRAILVRPGESDVGVDVEIVAGDGALTVEMSAAR